MTTMRELAQALYEARSYLGGADFELQNSKREWESKNRQLIDKVELAKKRLAEADGKLRAFALAEWGRMGEKALGSGVNIRVETRLGYDPVTALLWAKKHDMALSLDKKAFEGLAKASVPPLDFVKQVEVATVTVAQDLAKVLEAKP